jgi:repressor LexA
MLKKELSPKQKLIFDFIADYVEKNNYSPSIKEIADHFSLAESTVYIHLNAMKRKGWITSREGIPRSFRLAENNRKEKEHGY